MAAAGARKASLLSLLPDDCWLKIFACLEAAELSTTTSSLSAGALALSNQPQLWVALLHADFCASLAQKAALRAWLAVHGHFHPRQLYIYKRREHSLDIDIARAELQQRAEQVREQERKQRCLRTLNFILVRVTHLVLCLSLLGSSVLLWLRLDGIIDWAFYAVFAPLFAFQAFVAASSVVAFTVYFLRSSTGWTFYWNRLRGVIRWLILYTSPWEGMAVLLFLSAALPLLAGAVEGDLLLPRPCPRLLLPFVAFWLAALCFVVSWIRRKTLSASCAGAFALFWLPAVSLSVLLFLRLSVLPKLPAYAIFMPSLVVNGLLLAFVGFLVAASFWLGLRGNRDWTEYASVTVLTFLLVLLPLFLFQLALLAYMSGKLSTNGIFIPWVVWLSLLLLSAVVHVFTPLAAAPAAPISDTLARHWRQQHDRDTHSDTELLLPPIHIV